MYSCSLWFDTPFSLERWWFGFVYYEFCNIAIAIAKTLWSQSSLKSARQGASYPSEASGAAWKHRATWQRVVVEFGTESICPSEVHPSLGDFSKACFGRLIDKELNNASFPIGFILSAFKFRFSSILWTAFSHSTAESTSNLLLLFYVVYLAFVQKSKCGARGWWFAFAALSSFLARIHRYTFAFHFKKNVAFERGNYGIWILWIFDQTQYIMSNSYGIFIYQLNSVKYRFMCVAKTIVWNWHMTQLTYACTYRFYPRTRLASRVPVPLCCCWIALV